MVWTLGIFLGSFIGSFGLIEGTFLYQPGVFKRWEDPVDSLQVFDFEAARRLRPCSSNSKIIFLSMNSDLDIVRAALGTGALGYVRKTDARRELLRGFDNTRTEKPGLGILSMHGCAPLLGGEFEIHSKPGEGTQIEVWVALQPVAVPLNV